MTLVVLDTPEYKLIEEYLQDGRATAVALVKRYLELSNEAAIDDNSEHWKLNQHGFLTIASILELASVNPPGRAHDKLLRFMDMLRVNGIKDPKTGRVIQGGGTGNERIWNDLPAFFPAVYWEVNWYDRIYTSNDRRHVSRRENLLHLLARLTARGELTSTRRQSSPIDYANHALRHLQEAAEPLLRLRNRPGVAAIKRPSLATLRKACIWVKYGADYLWRETVKADMRYERDTTNYFPPGIREFSQYTWAKWKNALQHAADIIDVGRDGEEFEDGPASRATADLIKEACTLIKKERPFKLQ